ncbi:hypothetical protein [Paracoccus saliphilus]|uniref:Uncharacterized protein n=1 Tax=Paracoccus saliphilus TaxID=405559 RepID=A0AA46A6E6_9RHOB|nr:hypothetical protein [Paracoccus saliphilus]WCR05651.1 hypothetical protein JHX88_21475 [Paracoccus saliphilus]SIS96806.1 hypothetical protein SAMN05421772_110113 [Paracoccus saliphilus]
MITTWLNTLPSIEQHTSSSYGNYGVFEHMLGRKSDMFSTCVDVELTAEEAFNRVADCEPLSEELRQYGMKAVRIDPAKESGIVMGWDLYFDWRNKSQSVRLVVEQFDRPDRMVVFGRSKLLKLLINVTVTTLDQQWSRAAVGLKIRPCNISAYRMLRQWKKISLRSHHHPEKVAKNIVSGIIARER